jgi:hypothetical protein
MTELTFAILKYGFLALLWVFVWLAIRSLTQGDHGLFTPPFTSAEKARKSGAGSGIGIAQSVSARFGTSRQLFGQHSAAGKPARRFSWSSTDL